MPRSTLGSPIFDIAAQRRIAEIFRTIPPDEFLNELQKHAPTDRSSSVTHALYAGWASNDAGEYVRARRFLLRALRASRPDSRERVLAYGLLGDSYLRLGQLARAEHCVHRGLSSERIADEAGFLEAGHYMLLARLHAIRGQVLTSLQVGNTCLARLAPENPMWVPIHGILVHGQVRLGRLAEAEALVERARRPENERAPAQRQSWALDEAECWLALAKREADRAARSIEHARRVSGRGAGVRVHVVFDSLDALVRVERREWRAAEALARRALERCAANERNSDMGVTAARALALALMGQDRFAEALEPARFAARAGLVLDRFEGVVALRLVGACHVALGDRDAARQAFREALGVHADTQFPVERRLLEASIERAGGLLARERGPAAPSGASSSLHRLTIGGDRVFLTADVRLLEAIRSAAFSELPVLVEGETGTGKELVARLVHELGPRSLRSFVVVDGSAMPAASAEAELFGARAGALPGVGVDREGLLAQADGGTLVLDGLPELGLDLQARLLRVVEAGEYRRRGDDHARRVRIRVVATSASDVGHVVAAKRLMPDLFFRLSGHRIMLRPLRARPDEIPALAELFATRAGLAGVTPAVASRLRSQYWPGNVRQLEMTLRLIASGMPAGAWLDLDVLEEHLARNGPAEARSAAGGSLRRNRAAAERAVLLEALAKHDGVVTRAARELGLSRQGFYKAMQRAGLATGGRGRNGDGDVVREHR